MATFRKHERLKSTRLISEVATKGKAITVPPYKFYWIPAELKSTAPAQIAFSVPKKNFKRAVDRNRLKRQMRECYRAEKTKLYDFLNASGKQYAFMIVFIGKEMPHFSELVLKFSLTLQRLEKDITKHIEQSNDHAD